MNLPIMLAATETDYTKIVFGVVFFLIWLASAATGAIAKRQQQQKRREMEAGMQRPTAQPQVTRRPPPLKQPPPRIGKRTPTRRHVKTPAPVAPPPLIAPAPDLVASTPSIAATDIATTSNERDAQKPQVASAVAVRSWMRPATLRQQFILTEIFQPPLSLREPRE